MEEKKNQHNKVQKLRINPHTTVEKASFKLEKALHNKEYSIFVKGYSQLTEIFTLINTKLCSQLILNQLTIQFESIKLLKFEEIIYLLEGLKHITNLTLNFQEGVSYDPRQQNQSLSNCLLHSFQNLTHLKISLSCNLLQSNVGIFKLYNFYRENRKLTSIDFVISCFPERSYIFFVLLEGIRFLENLKNLQIKTHFCKAQSSQIIDILEDELRDNSSIQEFSLHFGFQTLITNSQLQKVGKIIQFLQNLENLSLSAYSSVQKEQWENTGLEGSISAFQHLKQLNLSFDREFHFKYYDLLKGIASIKSLESVALSFHIFKKEQITNDLFLFAKSISEIKNLTKLSITFGYDFPMHVIKSIVFVGYFHNLQRLTELSISLSSIKEIIQATNMIQTDLSKFREVINRLTAFKFKKNAEQNCKYDINYDSIIKCIQSSENLEDLSLEFNNFYECKEAAQTLQLNDFLENKTKLKYICLNFDKHFMLDNNQMLCVYQRLQFNSQLKFISISTKNNLKITELELKELSYSLQKLNFLTSLYLSFQSQMENNGGMNLFASILCKLKTLRTFSFEFSKENLSLKTLNNFIENISLLPKLKNLTLRIKGEQQFTSAAEEQSFGNSFKFPAKLSSIEIQLEIPKLEYKNLNNIFKQIAELKSIEYLSLFFQFEATLDDCIEIKEHISKLKLLKELSFHSYSFQMLHLLKLFEELIVLQVISYTDENKDIVKANKKTVVDQNTGNLIENISLVIQKENFFMVEFYEKEHAFQIIPFVMKDLTLLSKLKLYFLINNYIGSDYSSLLFKNMKTLCNLEELKIHIQENNYIGTESINTLGETILLLPQLRKLSFIFSEEQNNIQWSDCTFYSNSLGQLTNLESLEIVLLFETNQFNAFQDNEDLNDQKNDYQKGIAISFFKSISKLTNLNSLDVVANFHLITQEISDQFNQACSSLKANLRFLSLSFESHTIKNLKQINKSILLLENLNYLMFHSQFTSYLFRLKRLVHFSKQLSYYPQYDYI